MAGRTAIGLDIGTSGVRAAELVFGKSSTTLTKFGQVALPEGAVRDGEVRDVEAVGAAIKQLWQATKFSSKKVILGISNQKVVVRQVELAWLPPDELRKSLPFQVQDVIPMPVEHAVLDFHPIEDVTSQHGDRVVRGLLVAASREMVLNAVHAAQRADLTPTCVDLSSFAVLRSLARTDYLGMGGEVEALVDVGAKVTNIVVHEGGIPRFVRILLMGGQDLTEGVAERGGLPVQEAEALKQQLGLTQDPDQSEVAPATRALEAAAVTLLDEVRGSLDYYMASSGSSSIRRVVLSGGGSRLRGFPERLARATRLEVVPANPMAALQVGKTGLSPEQLSYIEPLAVVPVGLALGAA